MCALSSVGGRTDSGRGTRITSEVNARDVQHLAKENCRWENSQRTSPMHGFDFVPAPTGPKGLGTTLKCESKSAEPSGEANSVSLGHQ